MVAKGRNRWGNITCNEKKDNKLLDGFLIKVIKEINIRISKINKIFRGASKIY